MIIGPGESAMSSPGAAAPPAPGPARPDWTTGMPALDRLLDGVHPGDNIVWQVDEIDDYQALVSPFAGAALQSLKLRIFWQSGLPGKAKKARLLDLDQIEW